MVGVGFLAFVIFTSNPFARLSPAPLDGNGLNPLLQDPGLAFHPPLLYLGYVGFSMAFSFAVAALIEGRVDAAWGRWVRPWTLAAWTFLTAGIALGKLVGLLRARLGRLVVLGSGGKCQLHSLAVRHRPAPLGHRGRKTRCPEKLDHSACHHHLLHEPARHLPGAFGCSDVGARLRGGPRTRRVHPWVSWLWQPVAHSPCLPFARPA